MFNGQLTRISARPSLVLTRWQHEARVFCFYSQEADEAFTSIAFALSEQLESLSDDDSNRQAWVETLAESRASYMEMVRQAARK